MKLNSLINLMLNDGIKIRKKNTKGMKKTLL